MLNVVNQDVEAGLSAWAGKGGKPKMHTAEPIFSWQSVVAAGITAFLWYKASTDRVMYTDTHDESGWILAYYGYNGAEVGATAVEGRRPARV
jgi:hypothetical protein